MRRLILGSVVPVSLSLLAACSGDPTEALRDGVDKVNPVPSKLFIVQGVTEAVDVTATDGQGNQIVTTFTPTNVGAGINVERDLTFRRVFVNDSQVGPPVADAQFRFDVTANELVSTSFTIEAGGASVDIPVIVTPDPLTASTNATASASGPSAQDPITLTLPAPYQFQGGATIAYDVGNAVVVGRSEDGASVQILALPGSTGPGTITGIAINYAPSLPLAIPATTDPVAVDLTVNAIPGTDAAATAPPIELTPGEQNGVLDAGTMGAADCGGNTGVPCQLYSFSLAEDADVTVRLQGSNEADLGLYFINAADGSDSDQLCDDLGRAEVPEACLLTFPAGDYLMAVVSFGPFYAENDPNPDWVAVQLGVAAAAAE